MDDDLAKKLLDELIPHLEAMETQSMAILQLLKDKGIATDKKLAPYLDNAGDTSSVKWLATRLRIEHLISSDQAEARKEQDGKEETDQAGSQEKAVERPGAKATETQATSDDAGKSKEDRGTDEKNKETKSRDHVDADAA